MLGRETKMPVSPLKAASYLSQAELGQQWDSVDIEDSQKSFSKNAEQEAKAVLSRSNISSNLSQGRSGQHWDTGGTFVVGCES
jgi:hypothetical protein